MKHLAATIIALGLSVSTALAVQPNERLADPEMEARARVISAELRCLVCQNQSIDDSNAGLARDLRIMVRERLIAGDSNEQVIHAVTERYGEFVLLRPRFAPHNLLLWFGPLLVLITGAFLAWRYVRAQRTAPVATAPLSTEEQAELDRLMAEDVDAKP